MNETNAKLTTCETSGATTALHITVQDRDRLHPVLQRLASDQYNPPEDQA